MIPSLRLVAAVPAAALLLSACGLHRIPPPAQRGAAALQPPVTATPRTLAPAPAAALPAALPAADTGLLAEARGRYTEAVATWSDWPERTQTQTLLAAAESAARSGDGRGTRALAAQVLQRANDALDVAYLLRADVELQKLQTYTGMSDAQLERMRAAELALASREGRRAWALLNALTRELAQATQRYVVAAGDSLWIISGRPEVYGNPYLWPLIWDANVDVIQDPNRLRAGQRLKIRSNPTIAEVVRAVETARSYRGTTVRIGEVREAAP